MCSEPYPEMSSDWIFFNLLKYRIELFCIAVID
jgi:hypothetical protein